MHWEIMNRFAKTFKLMKKLYTTIVSGLLPFALSATIINGGNYNGNNLIPANGDTLNGTFTNVGNFHVQPGVTVYVLPGTPLSITAQCINIEGVINGTGAGFAGGGMNPNYSTFGLPGLGPGPGAPGEHGPCVHGTGGGGGANGGNGGNSSWLPGYGTPAAPAMGGTAYGNLDMGSGGGSGCKHCYDPNNYGLPGLGGNGGGLIELVAVNNIFVSGSILADGQDGEIGQSHVYGGAGGGAGGGGSIILNAPMGFVTGTLSAKGGKGGDGGPNSSPSNWAMAGGGGGGGKVSLASNICKDNAFINVAGGLPGVSISTYNPQQGTAGQVGIVNGGQINCAPVFSITGPNPVCEGDTVSYFVNLVSGISQYNWTVPGGSSIINGQGDTLINMVWGANGGYVYVQAANACGGSSFIDSMQVTVNPKPTVTFTLATDSVCSSAAPFALTGGSPNGGTYSGNGVSGGNFSAVQAGIGTHSVYYTYTDGNGCSNTATESIVVYICAGIQQMQNDITYKLFPNPFKNNTFFDFGTTQFLSGRFTITDTQGKIIETGSFSGNTLSINRNDKSAGNYIISIFENKQLLITEKLIVE